MGKNKVANKHLQVKTYLTGESNWYRFKPELNMFYLF